MFCFLLFLTFSLQVQAENNYWTVQLPAHAERGESLGIMFRYAEGNLPIAGFSMKLEPEEGVAITDIVSRSGIHEKELSWNTVDDAVYIMYMDEQAGQSPLQEGEDFLEVIVTVDKVGNDRIMDVQELQIFTVDKDLNYFEEKFSIELQWIGEGSQIISENNMSVVENVGSKGENGDEAKKSTESVQKEEMTEINEEAIGADGKENTGEQTEKENKEKTKELHDAEEAGAQGEIELEEGIGGGGFLAIFLGILLAGAAVWRLLCSRSEKKR